MMLSSLLLVQQAAIGNCLSFDPFPFDQNGLAPTEVDVGGREVADALMIPQVIVIGEYQPLCSKGRAANPCLRG
jgi:hypothetical protein